MIMTLKRLFGVVAILLATLLPAIAAGPIYSDRVQDTSTTSGTSDFVLSGSAPTGLKAWSAVGNGNTSYYLATDTAGDWEVGLGTYSSTGPTLARTTVLSSSTGSKVSFPAGTMTISQIEPAVASGGTLTQIICGSGLSGGTITVSGTCSLTTPVSAANGGTGSSSLSGLLQAGTTNTVTVGYTLTPYNIGTVSSGTTTPAAANSNYQYLTNNGAFTLAAPSSDCAIDVLITNGASAGAITFSGFTVGSSTGDALTTTNANQFVVSILRINGTSTYTVKALQ